MDHSAKFMRQGGFYSREELSDIGFESFGDNVLLSRTASIYRPEVISLGNNVRIDDFSLLSGGKGIQIGSYVHIGAYAALFGGAGITMEDFSGVSPRATVFSESDDFMGRSLTGPTIPMKYKPAFISAPVIFRKHSGMGVSSTILPGVEMGEGAGLAAHSMATKSCAPWTISFGVPAKQSVRRRRNVLLLEQQFMDDLAAEHSNQQG
jgi:galactoside O-acetyltransferase